MRAPIACSILLLPGLALAQPVPPAGPDVNGEPAPPSSPACSIDVLTRDRLVRSGDVEVGPGEPPRSVVSLDGRVRVRSGAVVKDVVALGGEVVVEKGAIVEGDVTALGGGIEIAPGAKVAGSATAVGGGVASAGGAHIGGNRASIRADVNGANLLAVVVAGIGSLLGSCGVVEQESD
jgi:hypothetical protein